MIVVHRQHELNERKPRRWRRRCSIGMRLAAVPLLLLVGALGGAYAVHDGVAREWVRQTAYKVLHVGNFARGLASSAELERLQLEISHDVMAQLSASRSSSLASGLLFRDDEPWLPATIGIDQQTLRGNIRLKGLTNIHRSTDKWSFRVELPEASQGAFLSWREFSIQHPRTRGFLDDWLYRESMRAEGVLAPGFDFANVTLNGSDKGVYAIEEHVTSPVWLASQQRQEGIILRMDDTAMWQQRLALGAVDSVYAAGFANAPVHDYQAGRNQKSERFASQRDEAIQALVDFTSGKRRGSEVFDVQQMSRFLALQELWSCNHVLGPPNARFYYNTITGLFEPIAGDVMPEFERGPHLASLPTYEHDATDLINSVFWPPLYLQDPIAMEAYVRELVRISQPQYLQQLREQVSEQESRYLKALWREYPQVTSRWEDLARRQEQLRNMLNVSLVAIAYGQFDGSHYLLDIGNPLRLPVEIISVHVNGEPVAFAPLEDQPDIAVHDDQGRLILAGRHFDGPMRYLRISATLPSDLTTAESQAPTVHIHARLLGHDRTVEVAVRTGSGLLREPGLPPHPSVAEALQNHEFLELVDGQDRLRIRPGEWYVQEDLILPRSVTLEAGAGTVLRFARDAVLLAAGPVEFRGTHDQPIVLEPIGEKWPGMLVLNAPQGSILQHVTIRGTSGIHRQGRHIAGGVTFYQSPAAVDHCEFFGSSAESALQFVRSKFDAQNSEFRHCTGDGLRAQFSEGVLTECRFRSIGRDALVAMDSPLVAFDLIAEKIGAKAISAERNSRISIDGLTVDGAHFGIASSEGSKVLAKRIEIRHADVALAAFVEQPNVGSALINASHASFSETKHQVLSGRGCRLKVNGRMHQSSLADERVLHALAGQLWRAPDELLTRGASQP